MGYTVYYESTAEVPDEVQDRVRADADRYATERIWLHCEPIAFWDDDCGEPGHLVGGVKPNLMPDSEHLAAFRQAPLPGGTLTDAMEILRRLSGEYGIEWRIFDEHGTQFGHIHGGVIDPQLRHWMHQIDSPSDLPPHLPDTPDPRPPADRDDDEPVIIKFRLPDE